MTMTPTIEGLTRKQKLIADLLWQCDTQSQMLALIRSLPTQSDQYDAISLTHMMIHETAEAEGYLDRYQDLAQEIIDRVR
jgi:hypothetical protein